VDIRVILNLVNFFRTHRVPTLLWVLVFLLPTLV